MISAIIAHEQNPATGLLYSLLIDGQDVMGQVPYESIRVTEAGPGAVSSMSFTVIDPSNLVNVAANAYIQMWDYTRDLPVFTGWVESLNMTPAYGGAGRDIDITCYGIEALLDQVIVPSFSQSVSDPVFYAPVGLQAFTANAPLRSFGTDPPGSPSVSSQAKPIGGEGGLWWGFAGTVVPAIGGSTIRQAFEAWFAAANPPFNWPTLQLTVDMRRGVRLWALGGGFPSFFGPASPPSDYATLTIVETPTGTAAASLRWTRDTSAGAVITAVYVKGGNAVGTGWVVGDTTQGRSESFVSDTSITTDAGRQAAGQTILAQRGTGAGRGALTIENFTPIDAHPGGPLTITNAALGWAAKSFFISQVDKTFLKSGKQNWSVTFFDAQSKPAAGAPSLPRLIRNLTRGTAN